MANGKRGRAKRPEQYKRTDFKPNGGLEIAQDFVQDASGSWKSYDLIRVKDAKVPINSDEAISALTKRAGKRLGATLALGLNFRARSTASGNKKAAKLTAQAGIQKAAQAEISKLSPEVQAYLASQLETATKRTAKKLAKVAAESE